MSLISQKFVAGEEGRGKRAERDGPRPQENDDIVDSDDTKAKRRKREKEEQKEKERNEMKKLENFLFGSLYSPIEFGKEDEDKISFEGHSDSSLFYFDRTATTEPLDYEDGGEDEDESAGEDLDVEAVGAKQRRAAWVDEEEEQINVNIAKVNRLRKLRKEEDETSISGAEYISRLRAHHAKLNPGTDWARLESQVNDDHDYDDESSDEENNELSLTRGSKGAKDILKTTEELVVKSGEKLLPGLLGYSRLVDANAADPSNGPINSVQFHQNAQLLLAAGLDRRLRFFQIDGKRNTKIQSIFLEDCPIRKASFLPNGSQVVVSGRRKFFYCFDLVKATCDKVGPLVGREEKSLENFEVSPDSNTIAFVGNEGYILLVSSKTKELIGTLKMNGTVRSVSFAEDGKQLLSSGGDGQVYHWDLRTRTCIHKGVDEGCINGTSLAVSTNSSLFAAGSQTGFVNIYNRDEFLGGKRKPIKALDHLTKKVDVMKFNHDSQILAICSSLSKNGMKMIHVPSLTAFSNWPAPNTTLHYPRCMDFSPGGGFMAMGNADGKVLLYKLHHYEHA